MNLPFIKYIEALCACKYPADVIMEKVKVINSPIAQQLPPEVIEIVYTDIMKSNPEYFTSDALPPLEWLNGLGIATMVAFEKRLEIPQSTVGIRGAFEILKDTSMYAVISSLAMAKIDDIDIELIVNGHFNIHYQSEDIKEFINYFFNMNEWTPSEKKEYIEFIEDDKLKAYYELALQGDKEYLMWKLGITPDKTYDAMLKEIVTDSFYHFKESAKFDPDVAQRWATMVTKVADKLERFDKDMSEKKSVFEEIEFTMGHKKLTDKNKTPLQQNTYKHISELK